MLSQGSLWWGHKNPYILAAERCFAFCFILVPLSNQRFSACRHCLFLLFCPSVERRLYHSNPNCFGLVSWVDLVSPSLFDPAFYFVIFPLWTTFSVCLQLLAWKSYVVLVALLCEWNQRTLLQSEKEVMTEPGALQFQTLLGSNKM